MEWRVASKVEAGLEDRMWSISSCIGFKNPILSNWSSAISWVKIELRLQVGSQVHLLHFWDRTFHLNFDIFWIKMEYIYIATYLSKKFDSWFCFSLQHSSREYIYEDQFHWPHVLFSASNFQCTLLKYLFFFWWYTLICCWDTIFFWIKILWSMRETRHLSPRGRTRN